MEHRRLRLGDTTVDLLFDGSMSEGRQNLVHNGGPVALSAALSSLDDDALRIGVNCFLLRGSRGVELVDAGAGGPSRGFELGHARAALIGCGVAPEAVDRVYVTHMHFDHVLGLLDGEAAFFPRAEILVPATDLAFYTDPAERERVPAEWRQTFDEAVLVAAAYAGRLRPMPFGTLAPGVELLATPGHSRGHGAYLFTMDATTLLLSGDLLHFSAEQAADPDLSLIYDDDPVAAAATRRTVLARAAASDWIVAGGHLRGFGRVTHDGAGFRIRATG